MKSKDKYGETYIQHDPIISEDRYGMGWDILWVLVSPPKVSRKKPLLANSHVLLQSQEESHGPFEKQANSDQKQPNRKEIEAVEEQVAETTLDQLNGLQEAGGTTQGADAADIPTICSTQAPGTGIPGYALLQ